MQRLTLPRDLNGEITSELVRARIRVARSASRVSALEQLLDLVWRLERELGRPVTLLDLFAEVEPPEQARRLRLVRALRPRAGESSGARFEPATHLRDFADPYTIDPGKGHQS